MFRLIAAFLIACAAYAQPLPGTQPLTLTGDPAKQMVDGFSAWIARATAESIPTRHPTRERLRYITGVGDPRVEFDALELIGTTSAPALRLETPSYTVWAVRWPVLEGVHGEGLLFEPKGEPVARVVAIPDADESPEQVRYARRLAESGCLVLIPVLIDRKDTYSGNPKFRMTSQPHREFIYRMAFPVGRHIIGYEVHEVLAAVDWFSKRAGTASIALWGDGE